MNSIMIQAAQTRLSELIRRLPPGAVDRLPGRELK